MTRHTRTAVGLAISCVSMLAPTAWGQETATTPSAPPTSTLGVAPPLPPPPATTTASPAPYAAIPSAEKGAEDFTNDHDRFIGRFGVTYFNIASLPIANTMPVTLASGSGSPVTGTTVPAPVIGVRYWLQRSLGLDVGVGMGFSGGSQETISNGVDTTVSKLPISGFAFHGGVPIAFAHGRHYSFLVVPQFTVGFATGTLTPQLPANAPPGTAAPPEQDVSGFLFDGGALVGAEIYFGFIGVPQLALQAAVGLSYRRTTVKWKSGSNSASDGTNTFGTNLHADPWAIFQDTISATYYF